jgi:hypothetical protein
MNLLAKLKLGSTSLCITQSALPDNAAFTRFPKDGVAFKCQTDPLNVATIEQNSTEQLCKFTYVLSEAVRDALKPRDYLIKRCNIVVTVDSQVHLVLTNPSSNNSWVKSSLEVLELAKLQPVSVTRDYDEKVYSSMAHNDLEDFKISDEDVEGAFERIFGGEYFINDLDHPMVRDLIKKDNGSVVAVDEQKTIDATVTKKLVSAAASEPTNVSELEDKDDWVSSLEIPEHSMDLDADLSLDDIKL